MGKDDKKKSVRETTQRPKVLILGSDKSGKTTLARILEPSVEADGDAPIGAVVTESHIPDEYPGTHKEYDIWDSKGSQTEGTINAGLYAETWVALILIDITSTNSANLLTFYYDNLKFIQGCTIFLVCNKIDGDRAISSNEIAEFTQQKDRISRIFEISATGGTGVEELKRAVFLDINPTPKVKTDEPVCQCLIF